VFDGKVRSAESYLLRHAMAEAVVITDPAGNVKPAKGRSMGRIDAACSTMLAVAEGARMQARPAPRAGRVAWA
jgi:phage terminase large subunit-like protein